MLTGLSRRTFEHLQLDAGIFLRDFDYSGCENAAQLAQAAEEACASGKHLLGATRGGGTFSCVPQVRKIEADGRRGDVRGCTVFDCWKVEMKGTLLELSAENIGAVLPAAQVQTRGGVREITLSQGLTQSAYMDHLVWIGQMSSGGFLLIDLIGALSTGGAVLNITDAGEGTMPFTFTAHSDVGDDAAPVKILVFEGEKDA